MISITELYTYPVKSLAGIRLKQSEITEFGLKHDRRWLVVDANGLFISQRSIAQMATIKTAIKQGTLILSHKDSKIEVPWVANNTKTIQVTVWKDTMQANHVSHKVDAWLAKILGQSCHLVYMPDNAQRQIDLDYAKAGQYVSFADAFPILLISQASLDDLNSRLSQPVKINRFRPNIVVSGIKAFSEDKWQSLIINGIDYQVAKPCSRCIMPSINQESGIQDNVKMLAVLNKYRKFDKKIKFGVNIYFNEVKQASGQIISLGDTINLKKLIKL